MKQPKIVLRGAIVLYFVIGLEILIMISPAAGFFYAAFNPFLLSLAQSPMTRWLTAFFLPHMISPPDMFLKIVRVAGSVLAYNPELPTNRWVMGAATVWSEG
ncbi:MAG: hypothetical protein WBM29_07970 [Candidatus Deferrimicrobium sp.]